MLEKILDNVIKATDELNQIQRTLNERKDGDLSSVPVNSKRIQPMSRINSGPIIDEKRSELEQQIQNIFRDILKS